MPHIAQDLRVASRAACKRPMFTAVVLLTVALTVGGASIVFTFLDALLLTPLPFPEADRLVDITRPRELATGLQARGGVTVADLNIGGHTAAVSSRLACTKTRTLASKEKRPTSCVFGQ